MTYGLQPTLVLLFTIVNVSQAITCYYCTIHPDYRNHTTRLCSMFDRSNHFHIDCPYSTFCLKRTFELTLQQGKSVRVSERGCAPQKVYQHRLQNGKWQMEDRIEDNAYSVGCIINQASGVRTPETEYCYCTAHLCNDALPSAPATAAYLTATSLLLYFVR